MWGLTVRLAAGSVISVEKLQKAIYITITIDGKKGGGSMPKLNRYTKEQLIVGTIATFLVTALAVQVFFRIIS